MTVPAIVRKRLNLVSGTELAVMVEGTRMVVEAIRPSPENIQVRRPKYTLDELLAGAEPSESMSDEESAWHDEAPKGREVW